MGIDSIKKAQLFGELHEYFDVGTPTTNLSLDDFPTLRHVLNFLAAEPANRQRLPAPNGRSRAGHMLMPVAAAPAAAAVASSHTIAPASNSAAAPDGRRRSSFESFLINFVVEQTGYPPEVVELDADLEADLGIDSIKKAQLFGELQRILRHRHGRRRICRWTISRRCGTC